MFPSRNPVHPFPDLTKWDPNDYYDVGRIHEVAQLDHNKGALFYTAYDLPNIDSWKIKKEYKQPRTLDFHKLTYGKKKKPRQRHFSTLSSGAALSSYWKEQFVLVLQTLK